MEKEKKEKKEKRAKHLKAQKFRERLETHMGRVRAINELIAKEVFDENDFLAIKILSQKRFSDCRCLRSGLIWKLESLGLTEESNRIAKMW